MRFPNNLSSGVLVLVSVLICVLDAERVSASPKPPPVVTTSPNKSRDKPGLFDLLQKVIHDKELSQPESLKSKSKLGSQSKPRNPSAKKIKAPAPKTSKKSLFRTELLRQELTKESQENCLAKLLCGEGHPLPPSLRKNETTGVLDDYGLLVKEFLDIFSDDPYEIKPKPLKDVQKNKVDKDDQDDDDGDDDEDSARSSEKFVNITTSLVSGSDDEIITTSSTSTVSSITTGATITELYPNPITYTTSSSNAINSPTNPSLVEASEPNKITLEEVVSQDKAMRKDLNNGRKSRHLDIELSFGNRKKSKYISNKIREMRSAKTKNEKLTIARKIAARLREPRQCKQFEAVASQILSTCPLTAEVVRYFNSNLKNGTQIALLNKKSQNATLGGGLVVLNDRGGVPHPYFLDNSPIIANTYINTDLKNPSVGDRFPVDNSIIHPIYENAYPQKFNTAIVSLASDPKKKTKKTQKKDSDEDEAESDENDEDEEDDQNDDEDDDDQNEERQISRYNSHKERSQLNTKKKHGTRRIVIKVKPQIKKVQQTRQLPQKKGVIQVYGVYQPSFDTEFSQTSTQIGTGPVRLFDHDYDGADVRYQKTKSTPTRKPKPVAPPKKLVSSKPDSEQASNSDEEDDDEQDDVEAEEEEDQEEDEEDDDAEDYKKRSIVQKSQSQPQAQNLKKLQQLRQNPSYRRPHNFATTPNYGSFPAPRPEEYYQNGKPLRSRPRPPTPMYSTPMIYKPRPELRRLNIVHAPGSALLRPSFKRPGRYQRY